MRPKNNPQRDRQRRPRRKSSNRPNNHRTAISRNAWMRSRKSPFKLRNLRSGSASKRMAAETLKRYPDYLALQGWEVEPNVPRLQSPFVRLPCPWRLLPCGGRLCFINEMDVSPRGSPARPARARHSRYSGRRVSRGMERRRMPAISSLHAAGAFHGIVLSITSRHFACPLSSSLSG